MLDINFIRENLEKIKKSVEDKQLDPSIVERVLELDLKRRNSIIVAQEILSARKNIDPEVFKRALEASKGQSNITPDIVKKALEIKQKIKKQKAEEEDVEKQYKKAILEIPNLPASDVHFGKDENNNEILRKWGEPEEFTFTTKDHLELGEALDVIDVKRASKVSGTRFGYLKNEGVLLEFALMKLAFEILTKEGFIPVIPPVLIRKEITEGLGYWQAGGNEDYYWVHEPKEKQGFYLVGTAEHSIVPMHMDETFNKKDLPRRYVAFSSAFRREAGSYGKDTRGILRVHQFDKIEMVSFVSEERDDEEHEYLLSLEEKLFQMLEIPYQVVKMCTGDLGFPTARKYDLEAWIPSQNKYREVTSVSTTTDFQARRLNIKYIDKIVPTTNVNELKIPTNSGVEVTETPLPPKKKYVHILNGTAFAIGRTIIAILENFQTEDGTVVIPEVLQKYTGFSEIKPK